MNTIPVPRTLERLGREVYLFFAKLARKGVAVSDVSTAPASYSQAHAQEQADQLNALLASLRAKGVIEE